MLEKWMVFCYGSAHVQSASVWADHLREQQDLRHKDLTSRIMRPLNSRKILCHWLKTRFLLAGGAITSCCLKIAMHQQYSWLHLILRPTTDASAFATWCWAWKWQLQQPGTSNDTWAAQCATCSGCKIRSHISCLPVLRWRCSLACHR